MFILFIFAYEIHTKQKVIKANELRIGNLVLDQHKEDHIISANCFQRFRYPTMDNDYGFYPIPITEEWLLKFGFVRFPWGLKIGELLFRDDIKNPCKQLTLEVGNGFRVTVQYVHQLQNLYFALTGEELKQ